MLQLQKIDNVCVFNLQGELSISEIEHINSTLESYIASPSSRIILNFEKVQHLHYPSAIQLFHTLRKQNGKIKYVAMNNYIKEICRFIGAFEEKIHFDSIYDGIMSFEHEAGAYRTLH